MCSSDLYWLRPEVWVGGGLGFALFGVNETGCNTDDGKCLIPGWGFDLRAGYVFAQSGRHTANISLEITPEMYSDRVHSWSATGFGLLLGYQFL